MCKSLGIKTSKEIIKGTHSFRRNAITDTVNRSGGNINIVMAAKLFGNTPDVASNNYYTGIDMNDAKKVLEARFG